jgi:hypothetical protein
MGIIRWLQSTYYDIFDKIRENMRNIRLIFRYFDYIILALVALATAILVCSCQSVRYVPVETVKTDSVRVVDVQKDSIYVRDSILIRTKADTIYVTKWRTEYREALKVDTFLVQRVDSINTIVEVEKKLTKIQQLKMDVGAGVLWAIPILIAIFVFYWKFKK